LDHAGNALRLGLPQDDRVFSLEKTKKVSGAAPTKVCPECETVIAASSQRCPECDHSFERPKTKRERVEEARGELVEVKPRALHEEQTHSIVAKFAGKCIACLMRIPVGTECLWVPQRRAIAHPACMQRAAAS
jgi:hypothetical protein